MNNNLAIRIIKILNQYATNELPYEYRQWLIDNSMLKKLVIRVDDCVVRDLEWTKKYDNCEEKILYVQDKKEFTSLKDIDTSRPMLILLPITIAHKFPGYSVFWYEPNIKDSNTLKTVTIYGIKTTTDEICDSTIKAYCATYDIALREVKKYYDYWTDSPANESNIIPIEVIVE